LGASAGGANAETSRRVVPERTDVTSWNPVAESRYVCAKIPVKLADTGEFNTV